VGEALRDIAKDPDVVEALLQVLKVTKLLESEAELTLVPGGTENGLLRDLLAAKS